jgi:hypothetical protein
MQKNAFLGEPAEAARVADLQSRASRSSEIPRGPYEM